VRLAAALLAAWSVLAPAQEPDPDRSDWERRNVRPELQGDNEVPLPPAPQERSLIEFQVAEVRGFHFYIDGATLNVSPDRVVRYVLVARSDAGANNISYEGLRCDTNQTRRYAIGRPDGSWSRTSEPWRPLPAGGAQRWTKALQRDYFCPQTQTIRSAEEGIRALQDGGHPFAKSLGSQPFGN
jgi:hypothetical protein